MRGCKFGPEFDFEEVFHVVYSFAFWEFGSLIGIKSGVEPTTGE